MNFHYLYRVIGLLFALSIGCPMPLQASVESNELIQNLSGSFCLVRNFETEIGLDKVLPLSSEKSAWIKLSITVPDFQEKNAVALLTQSSLFYGTRKLDRRSIVDCFDEFEFDIDSANFSWLEKNGFSFRFAPTNNDSESMLKLFTLIHEVAFCPLLTDEGIELARRNLLEKEMSKEEIHYLKSVTASEVRKFYAETFLPERMHLKISGFDRSYEEIFQDIGSAFGSVSKEFIPHTEEVVGGLVEPDSFDVNKESFVSNYITTDGDNTRIIDGKIYMKDPNWINRSSNGKVLGACLTIMGFGSLIIFPLVFPAAITSTFIAAAMVSGSIGVYFSNCSYLKDPSYVDNVRKLDLKNGCAFAYKNNRAHITLTPFERRALFLREMVDNPKVLLKTPILLLTEFYSLNDPTVCQMFTCEEFNGLNEIKRNFIRQKNQLNSLKEMLENELIAITLPFSYARDAALDQVHDIYNKNYYVSTELQFRIYRDECIERIENAFRANQISFSDRENQINDQKYYYDSNMLHPDFMVGLDMAKQSLYRMELEIQATYSLQVELCSQSIQYNERKARLNHGIQAVITYFDGILHNFLCTIVVYNPLFADYLDLR